jgi:hypothetical protein
MSSRPGAPISSRASSTPSITPPAPSSTQRPLRGPEPHACTASAVELHIARRVHLAAEVRNLFNLRTTTWRPPIAGAPAITVPVSDFFFYPLPGTSLWTSLRVDLNLPT